MLQYSEVSLLVNRRTAIVEITELLLYFFLENMSYSIDRMGDTKKLLEPIPDSKNVKCKIQKSSRLYLKPYHYSDKH